MLTLVTEARLVPDSVDDAQPFVGARVAVVMLLEMDAVASSLVLPPGRHDVERETAAADVIDARSLLGEDCRLVKRGADRHHQLQLLGDGGQRGRRGPRLQRVGIDTLDVVHEEFGDERYVVADLLASLRQFLHVVPGGCHSLVGDVAQPAAEYREPIAVSHQRPPAPAVCLGAARTLGRAPARADATRATR